MSVRYCIGCIHMQYKPPGDGVMYSTMTGYQEGSAAALMCQKNHWQLYLDEWGDEKEKVLDMENAMLHANTCPDFAQRVQS